MAGKEKKDNLSKLFCEMETNLEYVGASAIEDKLQEGVPETIKKLMDADIKVWVLTGDKLETAVEIGKACNLIRSEFDMVTFDVKSFHEFNKVLQEQCIKYVYIYIYIYNRMLTLMRNFLH